MEGYLLKNCFKKLLPIIADELSEHYRSDDDGSRLSKLFDIDTKYCFIFKKQNDVKLRIAKIIHYWITIHDGKATLGQLLKILEYNGMWTARDNMLRKSSCPRPEFVDKDEPGHIPRLKEILTASEIFYDNQSLLVYGEIGIGKTYFVKRLLNIYFQGAPESPREITIWLDFQNFSSSLAETCDNLDISFGGIQPYDLVIKLLNSQPDFLILDGFSLANELWEEYFTLCQKFQKEYYYKMIVITDETKGWGDFDLAIQIKPLEAEQVLKFAPELNNFPNGIADFCGGNPAMLKVFKRLANDGKLTEEGTKLSMIQNFKSSIRRTHAISDTNRTFQDSATMMLPRGKKRPREQSITQKFMDENFPQEIRESRKYFAKMEPESSLTKKTGNEHIIYFEPFLKYWLLISGIPSALAKSGNIFEIRIQPVAWATAFNQRDLASTIQFVWKAMVHSECRKIIILDKIARDNMVKIIQRAVIFMMSKFHPTSYINPWSFPSSFHEIMTRFPEPDEAMMAVINSTLRNYDSRRENDEPYRAQFLNELSGRMDGLAHNFWDDVDLPDDYEVFIIEAQKEETKYEEMFKRCVMAVRNSNIGGIRMDTAQIAAALTKSTIPQNTDQHVDGVQFSEKRWKAAFKQGEISIAKVAAKLSSTIIRLDFGDVGQLIQTFKGVGSICSVKMLAIYRASKFLYERRHNKRGYEEMYDSQIPDHNVYPTLEECRQIDEEIWIHGRNNVLGRLKDLLTLDPSGAINSPTLPNMLNVANFQNQPHCLPHSPAVFQATSDSGQMDVSISPDGLVFQNLVLSPRQGDDGLEDAQRFTCVQNFLDKETLKEWKRTGLINGIEPKLLREDYTKTSYMSLTLKIGETTRTHAFCHKTWTGAEKLYRSNGPVHMGRQFLIKEIFDEDELRDATPTGRRMRGQAPGEEKQLDENRQWQILDLIRYLVSQGERGVCRPALYIGPWSNPVEKNMRTEVITFGSNKIRGTLKKTLIGNCTQESV
ncbi:uncharacterized protein LOC110860321 [Folsomia candida]|uniref:uncharacterized protein LOC110860321 n=1 Tax=Folsomia candida TaxID=158441 RepID=UPI001605340F|nr:uncharacterized protein LOC110860321 [Folsomia candida]XP_035716143.1 uncharacterized protein LOC110860321 [Folsomia candida]